eukprot:TRINITY_DN5977_c0_g2_i1.p1 TRINITY_DN5977_c0_g2~~TRINITY_DN5977_c0_g2_i1.p1  ORF type:complete len:166 (-),score=31.48 TRINITY_DN5977_c0_g2_i1:131-628(-)
MPASAGRVKMPANNRVATGDALKTHGIWANTIGDPYAPVGENDPKGMGDHASAYDEFKGLLALARLTGGKNEGNEVGTCKKCGGAGHLTFQCRNHLAAQDKPELAVEDVSSTSSEEDSDDESDGEPRFVMPHEEKRSEVKAKKRKRDKEKAVSYTHLTLPTKRIV